MAKRKSKYKKMNRKQKAADLKQGFLGETFGKSKGNKTFKQKLYNDLDIEGLRRTGRIIRKSPTAFLKAARLQVPSGLRGQSRIDYQRNHWKQVEKDVDRKHAAKKKKEGR